MRIASHFNGAAILIDAGEQCRGDDEDRSIKSVRSGVTRGSALSWRLLPPGAAGFGPGAQHHDISRCNPDFDELNDIVDIFCEMTGSWAGIPAENLKDVFEPF